MIEFFFQENLRWVIILVLSNLILSHFFSLLNPELVAQPHPGSCLCRYASELNSYSLEIRHVHIVLIKKIFFQKWKNLTLKGRKSQRFWDWRLGRNKELFCWPPWFEGFVKKWIQEDTTSNRTTILSTGQEGLCVELYHLKRYIYVHDADLWIRIDLKIVSRKEWSSWDLIILSYRWVLW